MVGDTIEIVYLPENPEQFMPAKEFNSSVDKLIALTCLAFGILFLAGDLVIAFY